MSLRVFEKQSPHENGRLLWSPLRGTGADPGSARWGPLLVLAIMLAYFAGWSLLFNIRNKDVRLVQPLFDGLVAVGLWRIGEWIRRGAAAMSRAWS